MHRQHYMQPFSCMSTPKLNQSLLIVGDPARTTRQGLLLRGDPVKLRQRVCYTAFAFGNGLGRAVKLEHTDVRDLG